MIWLGKESVGVNAFLKNEMMIEIPENTITNSEEVHKFFLSKIPMNPEFYIVMLIDFNAENAISDQLLCAFYAEHNTSYNYGLRFRDKAIVAFTYANRTYDNRLKPGTKYILAYTEEVT